MRWLVKLVMLAYLDIEVDRWRRRSLIGVVALLLACCGSDPSRADPSGSSGAGSSDGPSSSGEDYTGPGTTGARASSSSDEGSSGSSSSGSGALAQCGDGVVDIGEGCDDGNVNDEDACHDDCTVAYTVEYTLEFDAGAGQDEIVGGLAVREDAVWLGGGADDGRGHIAPTLWRLGPDAERLTSWSYDPPEITRGQWSEIAAHPSGDLIAVGYVRTDVSAGQALIARIDPALPEPVWVRRLGDTMGVSFGAGLAIGPQGQIAWGGHNELDGGDTGFDVFVELLDADGVQQWQRSYAGAADRADTMRGVVVDGEGRVFALAQSQEDLLGATPWAGAWSPEGESLWSVSLEGGETRAFVLDDFGDLLIAGHDGGAWVERRNASRFAMISRDVLPGGPIINAVALDDAGGVWAAGSRSVTGESLNIWAGHIEPGAELDWEDGHDGGADLNDLGVAIVRDGDAVVAAGVQTVLGEGSNIWVRRYGIPR